MGNSRKRIRVLASVLILCGLSSIAVLSTNGNLPETCHFSNQPQFHRTSDDASPENTTAVFVSPTPTTSEYPSSVPITPKPVDSDLPTLKTDLNSPLVLDSTVKDPTDSIPQDSLICPKWEAYDKRIQMAKDFSNNCKRMDSILPDFSVSLCTSKYFCGQGYFLVSRINNEVCATQFNQTLSLNENVDSYFKRQLGPDAFHVIFEGPEKASPSMWKHLGDCSYKLPYRLVNPGRYTVQLIHAYESFRAVNEVQELWPQPTFKHILLPGTEMYVCPECTIFSSKRLEQEINPHLLVCSRKDPQQGVYLRMTMETEREVYNVRNFGHPYIWEPLGCRFDQRFESHTNSSCHSSQTQSIGITGDSHSRILTLGIDQRLSGITDGMFSQNVKYSHIHKKYFDPEDLKEHPEVHPRLEYDLEVMRRKRRDDDFESTSFTFTAEESLTNPENDSVAGDFHEREQINLVLQDHEFPDEEEPDKEEQLDPLSYFNGLNSTEIEYKYREHMNLFIDPSSYRNYDAYILASEAEKELLQYDSVIFNVGHWPASGISNGGHFSVERYIDMLEYGSSFMQAINNRRYIHHKQPIDFIWMGVYAFHVNPDPTNFQAEYLDWRVNYRLKVWSDYAERVFMRRGWKMLNGFDITFPWTQESPDMAHYHTTPALDAQVDEALHKLNICEMK
ncbi:UNVERIFIED_CONTAM: hypothetical protein HDU68_002462 [Siphonaria sp. JEL0065]|nr:hypothetical protein HDU68_002462 [Siphonaria sp. JEL0065]